LAEILIKIIKKIISEEIKNRFTLSRKEIIILKSNEIVITEKNYFFVNMSFGEFYFL